MTTQTQNVIYTTPTCPWCQRAKLTLDRHGIAYTEIDVSADAALQAELIERSGRRTVPQIYFGDEHIGGYDDLVRWLDGQVAA